MKEDTSFSIGFLSETQVSTNWSSRVSNTWDASLQICLQNLSINKIVSKIKLNAKKIQNWKVEVSKIK